eukprot:m.37777 g.37777  ORF g.37777 m.37777 type:complete len:328 (-) comp7735_c0_seq1:191-1174(-)
MGSQPRMRGRWGVCTLVVAAVAAAGWVPLAAGTPGLTSTRPLAVPFAFTASLACANAADKTADKKAKKTAGTKKKKTTKGAPRAAEKPAAASGTADETSPKGAAAGKDGPPPPTADVGLSGYPLSTIISLGLTIVIMSFLIPSLDPPAEQETDEGFAETEERVSEVNGAIADDEGGASEADSAAAPTAGVAKAGSDKPRALPRKSESTPLSQRPSSFRSVARASSSPHRLPPVKVDGKVVPIIVAPSSAAPRGVSHLQTPTSSSNLRNRSPSFRGRHSLSPNGSVSSATRVPLRRKAPSPGLLHRADSRTSVASNASRRSQNVSQVI